MNHSGKAKRSVAVLLALGILAALTFSTVPASADPGCDWGPSELSDQIIVGVPVQNAGFACRFDFNCPTVCDFNLSFIVGVAHGIVTGAFDLFHDGNSIYHFQCGPAVQTCGLFGKMQTGMPPGNYSAECRINGIVGLGPRVNCDAIGAPE